MIRCAAISKKYRKGDKEVRSLDEVSLEIGQGEFIIVRGPSGSGKTTLLLLLGGMLRPTSGKLFFENLDLYTTSPRERAEFRAKNVGFIFQMFHLVPYLSVFENILLASPHTPTGKERKRSHDLLGELGLADRMTHTPAELSAGERQRAAIARALFNQPKLILADEPTGNLDSDNAAEVFKHLEGFKQKGGTVVLVTHGLRGDEEADRILQLENGKLLTETTARATISGPT